MRYKKFAGFKENMNEDYYFVRDWLIKIAFLMFFTPIGGWVVMTLIDGAIKAWKESKIKRWLISCWIFFFVAVIGGWLL